MILGRDMVSHILNPLFLCLNTCILRWEDAIPERCLEDGLIGNLVHPFDALGEDFGISAVPEIPRIYARVLRWVWRRDMNAAA
jgi:hypothetical protein